MDAVHKWLCRHHWGFPRRWREFHGLANADVQTCTKCGSRRLCAVQFGPAREHVLSAPEIGGAAHESPTHP